MPRQAIQMRNNEKKTDVQPTGGVASSSNRSRTKCTNQKKAQKSSHTIPNDRGDGGPKNVAQKSKDALKGAQKHDEVEDIVLAIGQQKPKKLVKKSTGRHYQTKQKTKEMLNEVNLLLSMDKFKPNVNTSKSYLRSVQKTLNSSLKNRDFSKNGPGIDPEVLSLVHEPIKLSHLYLLNWQNKNPSGYSQESFIDIPETYIEFDKHLSDPSSNFCVQTESKREDDPQEESEDAVRETNVKSLLTFWNDKLSNKVDILYSCLHNPQKCSPPVVKPVVKLSSDGVDEEHTLKPSDIKIGKGPPGIAELLTRNSKNIIRRIKSHKSITASNDKDISVRNVVKKDQVISQLQQNKTFNKNKNNSVDTRSKKTPNIVPKNIQKGSKTKIKKPNISKKINIYFVGELRKETVSSESYSYMYVVNYIVEYVKVYRDKSRSAIKHSSKIQDLDSEKSKKCSLSERKSRSTTAEIEGSNEFTISVEKVTLITGIKAGILLPLLQIMNKNTLPGNMCKLSRAELKKLRQIGGQLTTTDPSFKGKLLYYLFDIEKKFSFYKEWLKVPCINVMHYVPKLSLLHNIKQYEAMDVISFRRHRLYFTLTLIMVVFGLVVLLLASSI